MLHHEYNTTVEAGINELDITIKYSYIDDEIEVENISLSVCDGPATKVYIQSAFYDRYKEKYLDDMIENACADIEDKKQYENQLHDEAQISAFKIKQDNNYDDLRHKERIKRVRQ